jgi:hypothetical protein
MLYGLLDDFLFFDGVVALPLLSYFVESPAVEGFVADALVALRLFIIVIFRVLNKIKVRGCPHFCIC